MGEEITVPVGTKIEPEEAATLDREHMAVGRMGRPPGGVEGQEGLQYVGCPWCGYPNLCYVTDIPYQWFICGDCGGSFRAT